MFDVFNEEIEVLIKDGLANLYWYKGDLHKAWLRSGVARSIVEKVKRLRREDQKELTKREQMDALYESLRLEDFERRLEVSRNFARILLEHESFSAQDSRHQIQKAQFAALRLRELREKQIKERNAKDAIRAKAGVNAEESYDLKLGRLRDRFYAAHTMAPQQKGYELERIFVELMQISGMQVEEPFRITGEQFDGAIKYEGRFYLIELKWTASKTDPGELFKFYGKVAGKMDGRGIFLSMSGFSDGCLDSLPRGRELTMMLLDGIHLTNVLNGTYTFRNLLDHAIRSISLHGKIYCSQNLS